LVAERVWVVPAFYDRWEILHRRYVEGLWAHPMGIGPLEDVVVRRSSADLTGATIGGS
jgi:hypothetical protein